MPINFDFPLYLTLGVLIAGVISLMDRLVWAPKRKTKGSKQPLVVEYARSFFPVLLVVWIIRSFIVQPYRVPTGSLEPTVMPGDFIAVNQFAYGLKFPVLNTKFISTGEPKRGDIALFYWPVNTKIIFVKRVIGLPGDQVEYKNKTLTINGKTMPQHFLREDFSIEPGEKPVVVELKTEDLSGVKHKIFVKPMGGLDQDVSVKVPKGMYFVMGDNRDASEDSRAWGFVPEHNLIGKAFYVWMSWDPIKHNIRWNRIGTHL